ncbi:MAG: dihydrodipicolinate synthase family protein [Ruminococcaceae bacterium]|nr:dihydrodipicolinate synthase family protein [Oscillospiraceae bacterium]
MELLIRLFFDTMNVAHSNRRQRMEILTTMITPYKKDGSVDLETAKKYVDWYFENGLDGIFAVCQSSEIFYLSLEEKVALNRTVYARAKELERAHNRKFTVVSSGHTSDGFDEQVEELCAIAASGTDALILITNRLDPENRGDDVFIQNAERLLERLPGDIKLGLYECPHPYKRLVTPRILDWCLSTGRFYYMKDTCCDAALIAERCKQLKGSHFKLLNANCQTLLESMRSGGDGYCGIMCNFHPALYAWLGKSFDKEPARAELIQSVIGTFGFTEVGLPYPLTAKYHMNLCGLPTENIARNRESRELTDYAKSCMKQMKLATDHFEALLKS